ncbi:F-box domain-containing protein [Emericellopsis atlantica]|uniref:F-box domain-containing protein n=1 Tax=Emericellopsis atlantica TaxID=2614577 RepID=A0A9P7ZGR0_9HYPO|nr:F-box domain-containing protein [Emericellopsis atlantica]KAG9251497.1 F-box domain-containing protein [Emericellopsis atlantica]
MSNPSLEPEILISRLSHRPRHLLRAMITITSPPQSPDSTLADRVWTNRVSSLTSLDRLPPEIMSTLLDMLDIQSISRFARVSFRGDTFVQSHRAYRDLVAFAPQVLLALGRVGLIDLHSVAELHTALRTERCATCIEYGAFLFLPTCERCCWECLRYNPSLRMLLPKEAKRYFGLSERHLQRLRTFYVIPGKYGISANPAPEHCRLVSVKAARALGLVVQGSAEKLAHAMARRCKSTRLLVKGRYLQGEPAVSQGQDLLLLPSQGNIPTDNFFGVASILFSSLSKSGRVEDGLWCRGCEVTLRQYDSLRLPRDVLATVVPPNCEPQRVLLGLERRAWSKESFLDHIKHCYGARQLVPELATGND